MGELTIKQYEMLKRLAEGPVVAGLSCSIAGRLLKLGFATRERRKEDYVRHYHTITAAGQAALKEAETHGSTLPRTGALSDRNARLVERVAPSRAEQSVARLYPELLNRLLEAARADERALAAGDAP